MDSKIFYINRTGFRLNCHCKQKRVKNVLEKGEKCNEEKIVYDSDGSSSGIVHGSMRFQHRRFR